MVAAGDITLNSLSTLCPSLLRETYHAAFQEIMLEISQWKQQFLMVLLNKEKG